MMQYERKGGVVVTERREEGISLQEEIMRLYGTPASLLNSLLKRKTEAPEIPTPDLKFESVSYLRLSSDNKHVIAVAADEYKKYLIRDDKVLLSGEFKQIQVDTSVIDPMVDLRRFLATTQDENGDHSLIQFNEGQEKTILEAKLKIKALKMRGLPESYLVLSADGEGIQTFVRVDLPYGRSSFKVDGIDIDHVEIGKYVSGALSWLYREEGQDEDTYSLFINDQLLGKRALDHVFNSDLSKHVILRKTEEGDRTAIILNGETTDNSLCEPVGDIYGGPIRTNPDFSWVAIGLRAEIENKKWLYYHTPNGDGGTIGPFDGNALWQFEVSSESIELNATRDGIKKFVRITLGNKNQDQDPRIEEAEVA